MVKDNLHKKIKQPPARGGKRIPENAVQIKIDYSTQKAVFSFEHCCRRNYTASDLTKEEFKAVHDSLRMMSSMDWASIPKHDGLEYKPADKKAIRKAIKRTPLPSSVPEDCTMFYFRASGKFRVFGYRAQNIFYLIWFDRNHNVMPM